MKKTMNIVESTEYPYSRKHMGCNVKLKSPKKIWPVEAKKIIKDIFPFSSKITIFLIINLWWYDEKKIFL